MGGTHLKTIELEDKAFPLFKFDAEIFSWETCLWRLKVCGDLWFGKLRIAFEYEAIDRSLHVKGDTSSLVTELSFEDESTIKALCDLALIRAIKSDYYPDAIKDDGDLKLHDMYRKYVDISDNYYN